MDTANTFGKLLRQYRETARLSRPQLAELAGLSPSHLFRLENGDRAASRGTILTLAQALRIDDDKTNQWLAAAGYKPLFGGPVRVRGAVRGSETKSVAERRPVRTRGGRPPSIRPNWLEAMGIDQAAAAELIELLEGPGRAATRQQVAGLVSAALERLIAELKSPVRCAVIPAAGLHHRMLATHVIQRLLLRVVAEAFVSGISQFVFVLAPTAGTEMIRPIEETLKLSIVPEIRIDVREQVKPIGLGDAVLCAEDLVAGQKFIVSLPDDFLRDRTKRLLLPDLQRMIQAGADLGNGIVVAVTEIMKSRRATSGVAQCEDAEVMEGVRRIAQLAEKPTSDHPILKDEKRLRGIVGRYVVSPEVLEVLKDIKKRKKPSVLELTEGIEEYRRAGNPVYGFEIDAARRDDVGALLTTADELFGRAVD
jgi:UTP--glucose-1-phosphate uridylyltransferase